MTARDSRPNIVFVMTDDHAAHAMGCYGSRINETPNLDRIADEGMRFDNCFCTNSICTPSRATILTGTYNHINGVTTLSTKMDNALTTFPGLMQEQGYQTAVIGKWHLGQGPDHWPRGFDYWNVLPGQGLYHDPEMCEMGAARVFPGYVTDLVTDMSIDWIRRRDRNRPFCLLYHHKAPHRPWDPDDAHAHLYDNTEIPEPDTFNDDDAGRSAAAAAATMRIDRDFFPRDLKVEPPEPDNPRTKLVVPSDTRGFTLTPVGGRPVEFSSPGELRSWMYQRYIKDYLRCVAGVDDNVGRLLDALDDEGITDDTMVVYTSDQGFFLGDHGWYDKRFMYEESLRMPLVIRYPRGVESGTVCRDMVLNVDFARTFLDYAGIDPPDRMQGSSFRPLLNGNLPGDWRSSMYYRYWMHGAHHGVWAHYGLRTLDHKLIYYYNDPLGQEGAIEDPHEPEWELFDLRKDGSEMISTYHDPAYVAVVSDLTREMHDLQARLGDRPYHLDR